MSGQRAPSLEDFLGALPASPAVYPQKLDPARQNVLLIRLDEAAYRAASFLDDRILNADTEGLWAPLARVRQAAEIARDLRPLHFIFHIGHVGSTLLSRLLDESGQVLGLREPLPLRMLADAFDAAVLETCCKLWSRGFPSTRAIVVKATSSAARLASHLLAVRPQARAVYLYLAPEPYLATLLAGENSPQDLRGHQAERATRLRGFLGETPPVHSLGELAAMGWLAERLTLANVITENPERVVAIDFDTMLSLMEQTLAQVTRHLGLDIDQATLHAMARSPVLTRYSKAPEYGYSAQFRAEILARSRRDNAGEIRKGLAWLQGMSVRCKQVADLLK